MRQYQIKITLKSDLCVSDGGVYNSLIDTDICYDTYGFPYIPGKRIKGCLRECAEELNDWGKSIPIEKIFGNGGNGMGSMRIGNAFLENHEQYKEDIKKLLPNAVACRQNVIGCFTYMRTQTRLDQETGVAETGSLRTFRVAKKGLVFVAQVELDEKYKTDLEACCAVLKHMGVSRTRGLGEALVEFMEIEPSLAKEEKKAFSFVEGETLEYELYLDDPIVCKSVNGGEENTQDYIEGSKILGILLQRAKGEVRQQILDSDSLIFSNAYISREGKRCTEVPASYFSIKNNSSEYVDKTAKEKYQQKGTEQLNQMKHCYVCASEDQKLVTESVGMEQRYHHRRPEDKGIGRVPENERGDAVLYQISSISAGQSFRGYILGTPDELKTVAEILAQSNICYVGYGKMSEYGRCRIQLKDFRDERLTQKNPLRGKCLIVKLEAPAIVYSEYAAYTTDSKVLLEEIHTALGLSEEQINHIDNEKTEKFINYTTVGGFNTTWGKRKPHIEAFDKGTVICLRFHEEVEIPGKGIWHIGERRREGFGEMSVFLPEESGKRELFTRQEAERQEMALGKTSIENSDLGKAICDELFDGYLRMAASENAKKDVEHNKWREKRDAVMPTVANLLLMCSENKDVKSVKETANERFGKDSGTKKEKLEINEAIQKSCDIVCEKILKDFNDSYDIEGYENSCYQLRYLQSYLTQVKYLLRLKREGNNEKSN